MTQLEHLTQDITDEVTLLMAVACDVHHPDWSKAVDRICDIERSLCGEARTTFYELLSAYA